MKSVAVVLLLAAGLAVSAAAAEPGNPQKRIEFAPGASSAVVRGTVKGYATVDYELAASAGQSLVAAFKTSNRSANFAVLPPGAKEPLFVGYASGGRFTRPLPSTGLYTLRVFLMRNAARRHETARYTLEVSLQEGDAAPAKPPAQHQRRAPVAPVALAAGAMALYSGGDDRARPPLPRPPAAAPPERLGRPRGRGARRPSLRQAGGR